MEATTLYTDVRVLFLRAGDKCSFHNSHRTAYMATAIVVTHDKDSKGFFPGLADSADLGSGKPT